MFDINRFLDKFKGQVKEGNSNIENIIIVLKKHTNLDFKKEDLEVKNGVLYIKTTPTKKNLIFIKKHLILEDLVGNFIKTIF